MTTINRGSTYCDACDPLYYWNSLFWNDVGLERYEEAGEQCVECCVDCETLCDTRTPSQDCVVCSDAGNVLETLSVRRGWWRATSQSSEVYECRLVRNCRGGPSAVNADQCTSGHFGCVFPRFILSCTS